MAKIIQFPVREEKRTSKGYENLRQFIEIAGNAETLNFYIDSIEEMEKSGYLLDGEAQKLTEQGRAKRLKLAQPEPVPAPVVDGPGICTYTPEMGQGKPECQMEAGLCYYGKHYWVDTPIELKGRGITKTEAHWIEGTRKQVEGWKSYRVTKERLCEVENTVQHLDGDGT